MDVETKVTEQTLYQAAKKQKTKIVCFKCGKDGHISTKCREKIDGHPHWQPSEALMLTDAVPTEDNSAPDVVSSPVAKPPFALSILQEVSYQLACHVLHGIPYTHDSLEGPCFRVQNKSLATEQWFVIPGYYRPDKEVSALRVVLTESGVPAENFKIVVIEDLKFLSRKEHTPKFVPLKDTATNAVYLASFDRPLPFFVGVGCVKKEGTPLT